MERGERVERGETAVASAAGDKECNKGRNESVRIRTKTKREGKSGKQKGQGERRQEGEGVR